VDGGARPAQRRGGGGALAAGVGGGERGLHAGAVGVGARLGEVGLGLGQAGARRRVVELGEEIAGGDGLVVAEVHGGDHGRGARRHRDDVAVDLRVVGTLDVAMHEPPAAGAGDGEHGSGGHDHVSLRRRPGRRRGGGNSLRSRFGQVRSR
jgi:hypothetical protein